MTNRHQEPGQGVPRRSGLQECRRWLHKSSMEAAVSSTSELAPAFQGSCGARQAHLFSSVPAGCHVLLSSGGHRGFHLCNLRTFRWNAKPRLRSASRVPLEGFPALSARGKSPLHLSSSSKRFQPLNSFSSDPALLLRLVQLLPPCDLGGKVPLRGLGCFSPDPADQDHVWGSRSEDSIALAPCHARVLYRCRDPSPENRPSDRL